MDDEIDDVMSQYKVEGIDPSMLEGVVEMPLPSEDHADVKTVDTDVALLNMTPAPNPNLPQMAAGLDVHAPESSEIRKALTNPAANDKLVEVIRKDESTITLLNTLMEEIAEEAAFIKAWRNANWDGEKDISEATGTRIKMLAEMVKAISEREKLKKSNAVGKVDFHSENFQNVLKYFMTVIIDTFRKVQIPKQYEDIFVTQLAKDFDGFEKKAEKIYYGKGK